MTSTTETTSPSAARFDYVNVHEIYAALTDGGSISVEEFPRGEIVEAAKRAEDSAYDAHAPLVMSLTRDSVGGAPFDTVWFHPDQDDRLDVITRARAALDAAEAALEAVGYVNKAHLCAGDFRTPAQHARNGFEIGRDFERSQQQTP